MRESGRRTGHEAGNETGSPGATGAPGATVSPGAIGATGATGESGAVRVVLHTLLAERGGAARVAELLEQGLRELGHDPHRTAEISDAPRQVHEIDPQGGPAAEHEGQHSALDAAGRAREQEAILHLHSTSDWPQALTAARDRQLHPVITLHDARLLTGGCVHPLDCPGWRDGCVTPCPLGFENAPQTQSELRAAVRDAAPVLVAPSGWLARMVRQVFVEMGCRVVPNGVEWDSVGQDKAEARRVFGIAAQARVAVFLAHGGERAAYKDGPAWKRIWEWIKKAEPRAVGFFVGAQVPEQNGREQKGQEEGNLLRLPYLDRARLTRLLTAADVLVYPSVADNHPLAILEAMSCGLPVAAMAAGGVAEQVRHGETGLLVPPGDRKGLATAAARLLNDASLARRMGDTARQTGRERFSHLRMCRDYLRIYSA